MTGHRVASLRRTSRINCVARSVCPSREHRELRWRSSSRSILRAGGQSRRAAAETRVSRPWAVCARQHARDGRVPPARRAAFRRAAVGSSVGHRAFAHEGLVVANAPRRSSCSTARNLGFSVSMGVASFRTRRRRSRTCWWPVKARCRGRRRGGKPSDAGQHSLLKTLLMPQQRRRAALTSEQSAHRAPFVGRDRRDDSRLPGASTRIEASSAPCASAQRQQPRLGTSATSTCTQRGLSGVAFGS